MAKLPIEIVEIGDLPSEEITKALILANQLQSEFYYLRMKKGDAEKFSTLNYKTMDVNYIFENMEKRKTMIKGYHPFIIAITDTYLESGSLTNIFGDHRAREGIAAFTISNVEEIIPSKSIIAYFLYYIARYTISFIVPQLKNHKTRGCIFDRKTDKRDLVKSMKNNSVCDQCKKVLFNDQSALTPKQFFAINNLIKVSGDLLNGPFNKDIKPTIFIGSSNEGIDLARIIKSQLSKDFYVEVWDENDIFNLGRVTIEALENSINNYDFGIFIFTPDDEVHTRGEIKIVPRDNVIFESGLFIGKLSRLRTFIIRPNNKIIALPSDLNGITTATYNQDNNLQIALKPACNKIRRAIYNINNIKKSRFN